MSLDKIGFYTLSDQRARTASETSPMMRCEMILTNACNFHCPYCRGLRKEINRPLSWQEVKAGLEYWIRDGLQNIRFSGGEPTLSPFLSAAVTLCKDQGVKRIAVSTNGFNSMELYQSLVSDGVNDFSVSLDACCASTGDTMAGGRTGAWKKVVSNIRELSKISYVSVGIVLTEANISQMVDTILFADSLGVTDIRVIPAAQYTDADTNAMRNIPKNILDKHPILAYRVKNFVEGKSVRGLSGSDSFRCAIVLDDSVIAGSYHFPCVIYMREGGNPIGKVGNDMRQERKEWSLSHNTHEDPICTKNCLDVCIHYNNQYKRFHDGQDASSS